MRRLQFSRPRTPDALLDLARRSREVVALSAVTGVLAGLAVAFFDELVAEGLAHHLLEDAPLWLIAVAPVCGLGLAAVILQVLGGGASPATADEYVRAFHTPSASVDLKPLPARALASIATLGSGVPLGYEGPAVYFGAAVGSLLQRLRRFVGPADAGVLLVAGAAAGVAAVFKAPATGAIFALEVPFQDDLARRRLLPALVGAAAGYLTFVSVHGTNPLIPVSGRPDLSGADLLGAVLVGAVCGVGARAYAWLLRRAKAVPDRVPVMVRVVLAGAVLAGLALASYELYDGEVLTLGAGYDAIRWALDPDRTLLAVAGLATFRVVGVTASVAGNGVGGLFVPLVVQGALTGKGIAILVDADERTLLQVVGIAAFLGAAYRVPLAGIMFVAEATGQPGFVVPGLLAAVFAQLTGGRTSVSVYQRDTRRAGHLEGRLDLPITQVLDTDPATTTPDLSVAEFFAEHVALARRRAVPVVDDTGAYLGLVELERVGAVAREEWLTTTVGDVMRTDLPIGAGDWSLQQALTAMTGADTDRLPVVGPEGRLLGVVTTAAVIDLERVLDTLGRAETA